MFGTIFYFLDGKLQLTEYYETYAVINTFNMLSSVQDSFARGWH